MIHGFTVAVVALKGGVGKSMIAANLACALRTPRRTVNLLDLDPQATIRRWRSVQPEDDARLPVVPVGHSMVSLASGRAKGAAEAYVEIYDTPPRLGPEARWSIVCADLVLIPITPGAADAWSIDETVALVAEARKRSKTPIEAAIVLNRMDRTGMSEAVRAYLRDRTGPDFPRVLRTELRARVAYSEAMSRGLGVTLSAPRSVAADEIRALARAVVRYGH